ncbi:14104_t:CDS:1, partial [Racocetra persica]
YADEILCNAWNRDLIFEKQINMKYVEKTINLFKDLQFKNIEKEKIEKQKQQEKQKNQEDEKNNLAECFVSWS